ncbi:hypothetical protein [Streptomyces sp. NBC_00338]|uniref:hypothetical protein n=1 Tax=Streptomyces sp. NBC_00338 TaxID=2975715 RepID=UPI00225BA04C|nr:hypothetical protein [Streptomyces sp. NBC_00338]MCX5145116.1 hypothetical protein [Streptomyces sp. NBC_00338]
MNHLPRPIADLVSLWSGLIHHPREVLLNRCHHQWRGAGFIALVTVLVATHAPGFGVGSLIIALLLGGPSWALDIAGSVAHDLWSAGRIWQGIDCQCCGGPDGGDDDTDPDEPADDGGLGLTDRDIQNWLDGQSTPTRA